MVMSTLPPSRPLSLTGLTLNTSLPSTNTSMSASTCTSITTSTLMTIGPQATSASEHTTAMPASQVTEFNDSRSHPAIASSGSPSTKRFETPISAVPIFQSANTCTTPRSLASTQLYSDRTREGPKIPCGIHATTKIGSSWRFPITTWPTEKGTGKMRGNSRRRPSHTERAPTSPDSPLAAPSVLNTLIQDPHPHPSLQSLPLSPHPPPPFSLPDLHQRPQSSSATLLKTLPHQSAHQPISSSSCQTRHAAQRSSLPSVFSQNLPLLLPTAPEQPSSPASPTREDSGAWSGDEAYDTPLTSPDTSPVKRRPRLRQALRQLDGGRESSDDVGLVSPADLRPAVSPRPVSPVRSSRRSRASSENDASQPVRCHTSHSRTQSDDLVTEEPTPLCPASPAKGAPAFPFPHHSPSTHSRHPSLLLQHCERNATPRQRRLMLGGMSSPDRYIASRVATPTKEGFVLTDTGNAGKPKTGTDPFAPTVRRTVRMAEQYATLRAPAPPIRPVGAAGTRVREAQDSVYRTPSRGTVWSVGGTAVTEGIPSTTNGRGGRVTSGTSAPHYGADFLRRRSQTDEQATHGRRLAHALDISQAGRMVDRSSPTTSPTSPTTIDLDHTACVRWRDGKWERPLEVTRLCFRQHPLHGPRKC